MCSPNDRIRSVSVVASSYSWPLNCILIPALTSCDPLKASKPRFTTLHRKLRINHTIYA